MMLAHMQYHADMLNTLTDTQTAPRGICHALRDIPLVNLHQYSQTYPHLKFNS